MRRRGLSGEGEERRQGGEQPPLEHLHLHLLEEGAGVGRGSKMTSAAGAIEALISSSALPTLLASLVFGSCNRTL